MRTVPFPICGAYDHLATSSAAALAGDLRDLRGLHDGAIEIIQGEEIGMAACMWAEITSELSAGTRFLDAVLLIEPAIATVQEAQGR
jgi:hypothetical protein